MNNEKDQNQILEHALYYAEKLEWSIIPIGKDKKPLIAWKKFQTEKASSEQIKEWFRYYEGMNIGVVTGGISNLTIIDIDPRHGGSDEALREIKTVKVKTGGGGWHYYFQYEQGIQNRAGLQDGIDVRSEGGYVAAPPSLHSSGNKYEWIESPESLPVAIMPSSIKEWFATSKINNVNKWNQEVLSGVSEGNRNDSAASVIGKLLKHFPEDEWGTVAWPLIQAWNDKNNPPLPIPELQSIFKSIKGREQNTEKSREKVHWPSPINEAAYYGLTGEIIKIFEPHTEADPVAILINFLTTAGSVIGDTPYFKVEASKHRMRIFGVLVGDTSKGRKGTSWDYIKFIFESIDDNWKRNIQTGLSSGEGLIWAVRDEIIKKQPLKDKGKIIGYQDVVEDEGIKDKRLLIIEPEFSSTLRVIGREGNTLSAIIRNAWDTGDLQTLTKNSSAKATGAHISIIGHITTEELLRYLTNTEVANGFGNRFLWLCVKRSKELPHGGNFQSVNFSVLVNRLRETIEYARNIEQIKWDERTYYLWTKIYHHLSQGRPGLVGSLTARSEAYVCRIASIYALLDKSDLIRIEHLKAAVAIFDYVEQSATYIFRDKTGDPLANKILEAITANSEGMTKTDINNYLGRNIDAEQISTSLEFLLKIGKIKNKHIQTSGRPRELFSLNSFNSYANPGKSYLEKLEEYILDEGYETNEKNEISNKEIDDEQFPY